LKRRNRHPGVHAFAPSNSLGPTIAHFAVRAQNNSYVSRAQRTATRCTASGKQRNYDAGFFGLGFGAAFGFGTTAAAFGLGAAAAGLSSAGAAATFGFFPFGRGLA
jgi:hypothetical protein